MTRSDGVREPSGACHQLQAEPRELSKIQWLAFDEIAGGRLCVCVSAIGLDDEAGSDQRIEQRTSATLGDVAARCDVLDSGRPPLEKLENSMRHSRR